MTIADFLLGAFDNLPQIERQLMVRKASGNWQLHDTGDLISSRLSFDHFH